MIWLLLPLAFTASCSATAPRAGDAPSSAASLAVPLPPASSAAPPSGPHAPQTATRIEKVVVESAPPTTRVVLKLDGTAEPEVSLLASQRLVIDVPNTTCAALPRVVEPASDPLVERVRTGQHGPPESKSRIVIDLRQRADFSVRAQGDRIVAWLAPADGGGAPAASGSNDGSRILFGAEAGASAPAGPSADAGAAASTPPPVPATAVEVPSSSARAAEPPAAPGSLPALAPPPPPAATPAAEIAAPPVAPPPAATLPPLPEATPLPYVEATPSAPPVATPELPIAAVSEPTPEPTAEAAPTTAPPEAPLAAATASPAAPAVEATRAAGSKRISIDFTEADVRTVIELIAGAGGYQVLFTPEVGGTVTISLVDRPWEDALATVLHARRLREVRHEDVMLISPAGR